MPNLLFLLLNLEASYVLFQLSLLDSMIILPVFKLNLRLFLQLSQLIEVLENQVLHSLFVNFDFNLILFLEILKFTLLIS